LGRDSEDSAGYDVAPSEGKSLAQLNQQLQPFDTTVVEDEESAEPAAEPPLRFSLRDLLVMFTFASIGLAAVRWLPPGYFAGAAGLVAFITLFILGVGQPRSQATRLVFWGVLTVYLFAAIATLVTQPRVRDEPAGPAAPAARPITASGNDPVTGEKMRRMQKQM
jgi:hypothetical protein